MALDVKIKKAIREFLEGEEYKCTPSVVKMIEALKRGRFKIDLDYTDDGIISLSVDDEAIYLRGTDLNMMDMVIDMLKTQYSYDQLCHIAKSFAASGHDVSFHIHSVSPGCILPISATDKFVYNISALIIDDIYYGINPTSKNNSDNKFTLYCEPYSDIVNETEH